MTAVKVAINRYSLPIYFVLTLAISWGGILLVVGPNGVIDGSEPAEERLPLIYLATLLGPSAAGMLMIGLVDGRVGYRLLLSRLCKWRVGGRWYAVALLTAPLLLAGTLFMLSVISPAFLPGIVTAERKLDLLLTGVIAGLTVGILEELGWTGFATPRLLLHHSIFTTGITIGILWGLWHFPLFSGSQDAADGVPFVLYLAVLLFSFLPPFRILMVWVFDHTESLLITMLMHASLSASILILPPQVTGAQVVAYDLAFAMVLWIVVVLVTRKRFAMLATG